MREINGRIYNDRKRKRRRGGRAEKYSAWTPRSAQIRTTYNQNKEALWNAMTKEKKKKIGACERTGGGGQSKYSGPFKGTENTAHKNDNDDYPRRHKEDHRKESNL